jgi:hypothetical protein
MDKIITGHLGEITKKNPERKGWFIGHFINDNPDFKNDDFEVSYVEHPKGSIKPGMKAESSAKTLTILISGNYLVRFPGKKIVLSKPGDYLFYDACETDHAAEASEDSIVLTVRWPSKR